MAIPAAQVPRLTSLSPGAGCACKLPLAKLEELFASMGSIEPAGGDLLIGALEGDDAAVLRLDDDRALVLTTDFFTPIVDDPRDWGAIAAVNAMSDVYAMGGRPVLAVNLAAWPGDGLPVAILGEVMRGGAEMARQAGCFVAGGHTIDDPVPKYGMAVLGLADPSRLITIDQASPGDQLILTKPIGTGIIATALKRTAAERDAAADDVGGTSAAGEADGGGGAPGVTSGAEGSGAAGATAAVDAALRTAVASMTQLNASASEAALAAGVRAGTDVTGFGLLGHLHRMLIASGAAARIRAGRVPLLPGAARLAAAGFVSGGTKANLARLSAFVSASDSIAPEVTVLLHDAQTSGGLLLATPPDAAEGLLDDLRERGLTGALVGEVTAGRPGRIDISA